MFCISLLIMTSNVENARSNAASIVQFRRDNKVELIVSGDSGQPLEAKREFR